MGKKATLANTLKVTEDEGPMEAKNLEVFGKNERKDNEKIEIQADGANDITIGNESEQEAEIDNKGEISEQGKLQQMIDAQAKEILDQQMKSVGKNKRSAAAAALNQAEMGIKAEVQADSSESKKLLSISSDQMYVADDEK